MTYRFEGTFAILNFFLGCIATFVLEMDVLLMFGKTCGFFEISILNLFQVMLNHHLFVSSLVFTRAAWNLHLVNSLFDYATMSNILKLH